MASQKSPKPLTANCEKNQPLVDAFVELSFYAGKAAAPRETAFRKRDAYRNSARIFAGVTFELTPAEMAKLNAKSAGH